MNSYLRLARIYPCLFGLIAFHPSQILITTCTFNSSSAQLNLLLLSLGVTALHPPGWIWPLALISNSFILHNLPGVFGSAPHSNINSPLIITGWGRCGHLMRQAIPCTQTIASLSHSVGDPTSSSTATPETPAKHNEESEALVKHFLEQHRLPKP